MGPQGGAAAGRCSFLAASGDGGGGVGSRVLRGRGGGGAAAAAGAGEPVGADAGVGLGTGGVKGTSPPLCSWLRWRPETLAELQVLDSGRSFVGTPERRHIEGEGGGGGGVNKYCGAAIPFPVANQGTVVKNSHSSVNVSVAGAETRPENQLGRFPPQRDLTAPSEPRF